MNNVTLIGRLGADPESRFTNSGTAVLNLTVCTNSRVKKGDEYVEKPCWHRVVVFGKKAEGLQKCRLNKGDQIAVEGEIEYRTWETPDGQKRNATQITARNVILFGGGGGKAGASDGPVVQTRPGAAQVHLDDNQFDDDDIPF